MEPIRPPSKTRQISLMMSGSFISTNLLLAYMVHDKTSRLIERTSVDAAFRNPMFIPIAAASAGALVASFLVPKLIKPMTRTAADEMRGPDPQWEKDAKQKLFTSFIVSMALADAVGVFGFVIGITTNSFDVALPFFAFSTLAMIFHAAKIK